MSGLQSPDGLRNERRKEARPGEILDAALTEFEEHGFAKATLGGIARRAGVSRGTIYLYYKDKDAIFDALLRRQLTDPLEEMQGALHDYKGDSETLLKLLFSHLHTDMADDETITILRVLAAEGHRFPHLAKLHHDRVMEVGMGFLKRIVERGIAQGEFKPEAAEIDMRVLIAPAIMALFWRMVFSGVAEIDGRKILDGHLSIVLDGLRQQ